MNKLDPHPRVFGIDTSAHRDSVEVVDPFDRRPFLSLDLATAEDVEQALTVARDAYLDRDGWLTGTERVAILNRTADALESNLQQVAEELAREGGKPFPDARVESVRAVDGLRNCAELLRSHGTGEAIPTGINPASQNRLSFATKEPIGVVVAVSAFNHPLNLAVHQIGPAVAAGCPFIIKPSTSTPGSAYRLLDTLRQCGLPPEWGQALVIKDSQLAQKLVCDDRVDFFSFIGSAKVGWMLRSKLSAGTRCALEHGGAAPVIVNKDVDIDRVVQSLAFGGFYHSGQVCISSQRVFAHQDIARPLADALAVKARTMEVGPQMKEGVTLGPMIDPREVDRVHQWVLEARQAGAQVLSGGKASSETCYPATLVWQAPSNCRLMRNEVFGPVVAVNAFESVDDALAQANALELKFQGAVYSADIDFAMYVYRRLDAACVVINDHTAYRVDWMPFAGLKHSGYGVGGIGHTYEDMQINKLAIVHSPSL